MRMTITMDNVTTDKALRLLSALEFGHLIEDTKIDMEQQDAVAIASEYLRQLQTGEMVENLSHSETHSTPKDAGDCDLFIEDFQGFRLQDALDAWIQGRSIDARSFATPLPRIGNLNKRNLISVPQAEKLLKRKTNGLYTVIYTGTAEFFWTKGKKNYWFTKEQVAILALAQTIQQATGGLRLTRKHIRQATCAFLAAFPQYVEETRPMCRVA